MKKIELAIEAIIMGSRWLLVVFYLGLALGLLFFAVAFVQEFIHTFSGIVSSFFGIGGEHAVAAGDHGASAASTEKNVIVGILGLIDASLIASLIVMVIISGYENFVSKIDRSSGELAWMGKIDSGSLKIKVASTIVAISSINLLEKFLKVEEMKFSGNLFESPLFWLMVVHITFVVSALLLAFTDKVMHSYQGHGHNDDPKPGH